jgi:hypothetical protein
VQSPHQSTSPVQNPKIPLFLNAGIPAGDLWVVVSTCSSGLSTSPRVSAPLLIFSFRLSTVDCQLS